MVQAERWGEFSPFVEYSSQESLGWLAATLEWVFDQLPTPVRSKIPVNATLPAVELDQVEKVLESFGNFRTVKAKVGETDLAEDLARLQKVREIYPLSKIRVDANGAWDIEQTLEFCKAIKSAGFALEYLEQPVASISEMIALKQELRNQGLNFLIAADESIRKSEDPFEVAKKGAADILVLKSSPLGGIKSSLAIAQQSGLPVVVSSALESSIGLQAELHFAASLPDLNFDCGLATAALFAADVVTDPLLPVNGEIELREVTPDEKLIARYSVGTDRKAYLIERLDNTLELLESGIDV